MMLKAIRAKLGENYGVLFLCALLILIITFLPMPSGLKSFLLEDGLYVNNMHFLSDIESRSTANAIALASINGFLRAVQSSQVGISIVVDAQVRIGEQIASLVNLTERGAEVAGLAALVSLFLQMTLQIVKDITPLLFQVMLVSITLYAFAGWFSFPNSVVRTSFSCFRSILLFFLIVHVAVPYSIHVANIVSNAVTSEHIDQAGEFFGNLHDDFSGAKSEVSNTSRAKSALHIIEQVQVKIDKKTRVLFNHIVRYFIVELITSILIPLALFYGLVKLVKNVVGKYIVHPLEVDIDEAIK